jgi:hypothetical protein
MGDYKGTCFCGAVEVTATGEPAAMGYCHCASCRHWSAGPVNAFTLWPPANVKITYQNVGLGYSGDPTGPDVAPLTTVELTGLTFDPLVLFGGTLNLPPIKASLTLEDGECSVTGDCGSSN